MNFKRITIWLLGLFILLVGLYFFAQSQMKNAITEFLERKIPNHIQYSYDQLNINLLRGNLEFKDAKVTSIGRQTSSCEIIVQTKEVSVKGFSYWNFFFSKEIHAKQIRLTEPSLDFKTCPKDTTNTAQESKPINLLKPISVEEIVFEQGKVNITDSQGKQNLLKVGAIDLSIRKVATDSVQIKEYIPLTFDDYHLTFTDVSGPSGEFEEFFIGSYQMSNSGIEISDFQFNTKLSRKELSRKIRYERDHISLEVPSISLKNHKLDVIDEVLYLNFDTITVQRPLFDLYRDKSLLDNQKRRPLYAELIRDLPVKLNISQIEIAEGSLSYEEDAPNKERPGILTFEDLGVTVINFSNMQDDKDEEVEIKIKTNFMGNGKLDLDWKFNVFDPKETFLISGGLSNLQTYTLNDFLVPNARLKAEGTIDQMFFTMSGGDYTAHGDIKMNYEDFKLQLLDKNRNHVKKFVSFLGNLFINDGSRADADGYRHGKIEVERNQDKSFFNYLWIGLEDGLIDVITGSGKKK